MVSPVFDLMTLFTVVMAGKGLDAQSPSNNFLKQIPEEVSRLSSSIDDMIWNIRPENDDLENFFVRLRDHAAQTLQAQDIELKIDFSQQNKVEVLPMDIRRNIFLIFKEALHNITKHADCQNVAIKVEVLKNALFIQIDDDGKGFDTKKRSTRNGLRNMTNRAAEVGGKIEIKSVIGEGTSLVLQIPIAPKKLII